MKILLVEDNVSLCRNIASVLQNEGYTVVTCSNGNEAEFQMLNNSSDLILLDRMLPGKDGITLTREARTAGITVPILLLTALDTLGDKVTGLDAGADDYIVKPFSPSELVARVQAHIATYKRLKAPQEIQQDITVGAIRICPKSHRVFVQEQEINLKNKEYELLLFLVTNADTVFDRETLYERIWGMDALGDNATVAVHINRLREKLEEDPSHPKYIETVWGAGYRFHA